jgi:hypothetical protein
VTPKKKEKPAPAAPSSGTTAPVQAVAEQARRFVECAAIVRAARDALLPTFIAQSGRTLPEALLQRSGEGPRAASVEAVVESEIALEALAQHFDERARALLLLPVALGERERPAPVQNLSADAVVHTKDVQSELGIAQQKTVAGTPDHSPAT